MNPLRSEEGLLTFRANLIANTSLVNSDLAGYTPSTIPHHTDVLATHETATSCDLHHIRWIYDLFPA